MTDQQQKTLRLLGLAPRRARLLEIGKNRSASSAAAAERSFYG